MQAIALLAAQRGFWEADVFTRRSLARDFAGNIIDHGLPGSGHTRPDHPLMDWVADQLEPQQREAFESARKGGSSAYSSLPAANDECQQPDNRMSAC